MFLNNVKFWWPLFLAIKFTFLFLNLVKIHIFIPKSAYGGGGWGGGGSTSLGNIPKKNIFLTASLKWITKRAKRPELKVTLVTNVGWDQDLASEHFDIIAINRYFGWYSDPGYVRLLTLSKNQVLSDWKFDYWNQIQPRAHLLTQIS